MKPPHVDADGDLVRAKRTRRGAIGAAALAAICCATPALVVALGAVGLGAWRGKVDLVVLPLLAVAVIAAWLAHKRVARCQAACQEQPKEHHDA